MHCALTGTYTRTNFYCRPQNKFVSMSLTAFVFVEKCQKCDNTDAYSVTFCLLWSDCCIHLTRRHYLFREKQNKNKNKQKTFDSNRPKLHRKKKKSENVSIFRFICSTTLPITSFTSVCCVPTYTTPPLCFNCSEFMRAFEQVRVRAIVCVCVCVRACDIKNCVAKLSIISRFNSRFS